ncbi:MULTISPECIES: TraR/DksA family transcriptional regulator [unclassified Luteococcus]|uniref:TraR/DksA family transcriptional regulator n=1 Tax=unclassified Luteococcus TaxID=2639923 RepID=UPI00313C8EE7
MSEQPFTESTARAELSAKATELRAQIAELTRPVEGGATIGFGKRIGEGTTQAIQQMADASTAHTLAEVLDQVERAQAKLDQGTYGRCDDCQGPIGEARLEFRPWSTRCVEHADG